MAVTGDVLFVDGDYVRRRARRGAIYFSAMTAVLSFAGLIGEYLVPHMEYRSTLQSTFGNWGALVFVVCVVFGGNALFWVFGQVFLRRMLQYNHVAVTNEAIAVYFGSGRLLPVGEGHIVTLRRDEIDQVWSLNSSGEEPAAVKLPMGAFPTLDGFLRNRVVGLIVQ